MILTLAAILAVYLTHKESPVKKNDVSKFESIVFELDRYYHSLQGESPNWPVKTVLKLNYVNFDNISDRDIPNDYYRLYTSAMKKLRSLEKVSSNPIEIAYVKNFCNLLERIQERIEK